MKKSDKLMPTQDEFHKGKGTLTCEELQAIHSAACKKAGIKVPLSQATSDNFNEIAFVHKHNAK